MNSHITSTPLINSYKSGSLPASPNHSRLTPNFRSPKYLIASPTCGTPVKRLSERGASPLANSTVNVSLYTNTQSPGLASRIVQYDRAQNGRSPTFNRKFGSPGIFPIVHLYKQSLPVASPKPKRVTVKIAPPDDLSMYNHIDHSIIMSENSRITTFPEHPANETGTRSVLDALKEISRKRIHSAAEFESSSPEGSTRKRNKRILESTSNQPSTTNSLNVTPQLNNNNKRLREESPPDMNCLTVSSNSNNPAANTDSVKSTASKRYCSIDPITASFTSANLRLQELRKGPAKNPLEFPEDLPESPLRKTQQVSIDTQTEAPKATEDVITTEKSKEAPIAEIPVVKPVEKPREVPLFDPRPLEVLRRNKLAALLGAINGETPILEKVPLPNSLDTPQKINYGATTISTTSIVPEKTPKHVTFDLPDVPTPILVTNPNITQTTTSLVMPIPSTMIAPSISSPVGGISFMANSTVSPIITTTAPVQTPQSTPPKVLGGFKFDLQQTTPNLTSTINLESQNVLTANISSPNNAVPKFGCDFGTPQQPVVAPTTTLSFGLPPASSTVQTSNIATPTFNFGAVTTTSSTFGFGTTSTSITSPAATSAAQPAFSFTPKLAEAIPKSAQRISPGTRYPLLFGGTTTPTTNIFAKPFETAAEVIPATIPTTTVGFPLTTSASTPKFGQLATGSTLFGGTTTTEATKPTFSFGGGAPLTTSSSNITFGNNSTNAKPVPTFGGTLNNTSEKPPGIATPTFGNAVEKSSGILAQTFGSTTDKSSGIGAQTFGNIAEKSSGIVAPTFVSTLNSNTLEKVAPTFGNMTEKSSGIVLPTFGTTSNISTAATTTNTIFGASPFAPPNTAAITSTANSTFGGFGTVTKTNTQPIKFGDSSAANNQPTTTVQPQSLFSFGGGTTEPPKMFANNGSTAFGNKDQLPSFGANKLSFGGFGNTSTNSTFGTNQPAEVAPPNQTVQPNTFGFGGGSAFGGTADSAFNKPASFDANQSSTNNTFGAPNNNNNASSFNSPAPAFGAGPTQPQQSKLFTFGTATATPKAEVPALDKPSGVFAFGTPTPKPPARQFNFSTNANNNNTPYGAVLFGAPNGGAPAPPQPVMQFGGGGFNAPPALQGSPGMFSIGSGSSSGPSRPRAQLKTKRRT